MFKFWNTVLYVEVPVQTSAAHVPTYDIVTPERTPEASPEPPSTPTISVQEPIPEEELPGSPPAVKEPETEQEPEEPKPLYGYLTFKLILENLL